MPRNPLVNPQIVKAFENDPKTKLANSMLLQGTNTSPTPIGGYAWGDGLARMAQAIAGAYIQKKQTRKYAKDQQEVSDLLAEQFNPPNPAQVPPGFGDPNAAATMGGAAGPGGVAPPQGVQATPQGGTQTGAQPLAPPVVPQAPQMAPATPQAPLPAPTPRPRPQPAPAPAPVAAAAGLDPAKLFRVGIIGAEGGTDRNGKFLTSPKGAVGPAQVMPGTAPEAAKLAGVPWDETLYRTNAQYNMRLGEAYFNHMLKTFGGDQAKAVAAYNAGPGGVKNAMLKAQKRGGTWQDHLPAETKAYVPKVFALAGGEAGSAGAAPYVDQPMEAQLPLPERGPQTPALQPGVRPQTPTAEPAVQSERRAVARRLLASKNPYVQELAMRMMDGGMEEQFTADREAVGRRHDISLEGYRTDADEYKDQNRAVRDDVNNARQSERDFGNQAWLQRDNQIYGRNQQNDAQNFEGGQRALDRAQQTTLQDDAQSFQGSEGDKDRATTLKVAEINKAGKLEAQQRRRQEFFGTPRGASLYKEMTDSISKNDYAIGKLQEFAGLLDKEATGTLSEWGPYGALRSMTDSEIAQMKAITEDLVPLQGAAAKGPMSDKDFASFRQALPSIDKPTKANRQMIQRAQRGFERLNDYERVRIQYMADGKHVEFVKDWRTYRDAVSAFAGDRYVSFDEWKENSTKAAYNAKGERVK